MVVYFLMKYVQFMQSTLVIVSALFLGNIWNLFEVRLFTS